MTASRPIAPPVPASAPQPSGSGAWSGAALSAVKLLLVALVYTLIALAWAASGRGDAAYAEAAAIVGTIAASLTFAICSIGASADRLTDGDIDWTVLAIGAAASAAVQVASLAVVRGDRAIEWNPSGLQALTALAPFSLLLAVSVRLAGRRRWILNLSGLLSVVLLALGATALGLVAVMTAAGGERWSLAPATLAVTVGLALGALAFAGVRRTPNAALILLATVWAVSSLAHSLAIWFDAPGWLAFGRWILPIGTLGVAVLAGAPAGMIRQRLALATHPPDARIRIGSRDLPISAAGLAATGAAIAVTAVASRETLVDMAVVGGVALLLFTGRQAVTLAAERARVDEISEIAREWQRVANIDALTTLPNRSSLLQRLTEEVERSLRYEQPLSVCFVDVDFFKAVNDTYGHAAGDIVLREVGERLKTTARIIDVVGRYGGEEFLVIVPGTWTADALILAERLRARIAGAPIEISPDLTIDVSVSIGLAGLPEQAGNQPDLLARADAALYEAKRQGRNQVILFRPPSA